MNQASARTPLHFWIVAVVSLLWNAVGAYDYLATKWPIESYMSQFTPEQLAYFQNYPAWFSAFWAFGVWGALFGSIALLLRRRLAVHLFALSILGLLVTSTYSYLLSDGGDVMGQTGAVFTAVIWIIAIALLLFARAMVGRGILR